MYGSAIYVDRGIVNITNCEIANNVYENSGFQLGNHGALYTYTDQADFNIEGSTIAYNTNSGVYQGNGDVVLTNTIVWGNSSNNSGSISYNYCNVQGGASGEGNISANPLLDAHEGQSGRFFLQLDSPCYNTGNPSPEYNDIDGSRSDIGANGAPPIMTGNGIWGYVTVESGMSPSTDSINLMVNQNTIESDSINLNSYYLIPDLVEGVEYEISTDIDIDRMINQSFEFSVDPQEPISKQDFHVLLKSSVTESQSYTLSEFPETELTDNFAVESGDTIKVSMTLDDDEYSSIQYLPVSSSISHPSKSYFKLYRDDTDLTKYSGEIILNDDITDVDSNLLKITNNEVLYIDTFVGYRLHLETYMGPDVDFESIDLFSDNLYMNEIQDFTDHSEIYISANTQTRAPHIYVTVKDNFSNETIDVFCERDDSGAYLGNFSIFDILTENYTSLDIYVNDQVDVSRRVNVWSGGENLLPENAVFSGMDGNEVMGISVGDTIQVVSDIETVLRVTTNKDSIGFPVPVASNPLFALVSEIEESPSTYSGKVSVMDSGPHKKHIVKLNKNKALLDIKSKDSNTKKKKDIASRKDVSVRNHMRLEKIREMMVSDEGPTTSNRDNDIGYFVVGLETDIQNRVIGSGALDSIFISSFNGETEVDSVEIQSAELNTFRILSPAFSTEDVDVFTRFIWESVNPEDKGIYYNIYISTTGSFEENSTIVYTDIPNNAFFDQEISDLFDVDEVIEFYPPVDLIVDTSYFWKVEAVSNSGDVESSQNLYVGFNFDYFLLVTTPSITSSIDASDNRPMIDYVMRNDRTLIPENNPYWISQNPFTENSSLTISAGTELLFFENNALGIGGELYINGTEDSPVVLHGIDDNTRWAGLYSGTSNWEIGTPTTSKGEELSLNVDENHSYVSGNKITHLIVENADRALDFSNLFDIYIDGLTISEMYSGLEIGSNSHVKNAHLFNNQLTADYANDRYGINGGVYFENIEVENMFSFGISGLDSAYFKNISVHHNNNDGIGGGSYFYNVDSYNNSGFGIATQSSNVNFTDVNVYNNGSYGVSTRGGHFYNCNIYDNGDFGLRTYDTGPGAYLYDSKIYDNNTFGANGVAYIANSEVTGNGSYGVEARSNATIINSVISDNGGHGIHRGGSFRYNTISNNNGYAIAADSEADIVENHITDNNGHSITGGLLITGNYIDDNGDDSQEAIIDCNSLAIVEDNIITNNTGYAIHGAKKISGNEIIGNNSYNRNFIDSEQLLEFSDNLIADNTAQGGTFIYGTHLTNFDSNTLTNNSNTEFQNQDNEFIDLTRNLTISDPYIDSQRYPFRFTNNTLTNCTSHHGEFIDADYDDKRMEAFNNNTISGCSSAPQFHFIQISSYETLNNIIDDCSAGHGIYYSKQTDLFLNNTISNSNSGYNFVSISDINDFSNNEFTSNVSGDRLIAIDGHNDEGQYFNFINNTILSNTSQDERAIELSRVRNIDSNTIDDSSSDNMLLYVSNVNNDSLNFINNIITNASSNGGIFNLQDGSATFTAANNLFENMVYHSNIFSVNGASNINVHDNVFNNGSGCVIGNCQNSNNGNNCPDDSNEQCEEDGDRVGAGLYFANIYGSGLVANNQITYINQEGQTVDGGGIYVSWAEDLLIKQNQISFCSALDQGAGIYVKNGTVDIHENTITSNYSGDGGSAIYLEDDTVVGVRGNIITNNTGEFAVWGKPYQFTTNNIFYNYDNDGIAKNLRYTGEEDISYILNFWGTRSDQGDIDPSIYDNNESESALGEVDYNPINTGPSSETPLPFTDITSLDATLADNNSVVINQVCSGTSFDIVISGNDSNEFSQDLTTAVVTTPGSLFNTSLLPLFFETDINSGLFKVTISLTELIQEFNPINNVLVASVGDVIEISSLVDPNFTHTVMVTEDAISFPESVSFNEDEQYALSISDLVSCVDIGDITFEVNSSENIQAIYQNGIINIIPNENWAGTEYVSVNVINSDGMLLSVQEIAVNVNPINDSPVITSSPVLEASEDELYEYQLAFEDIDDDQLYFSLVSYPDGMEIDSQGLITWTPGEGISTSGQVIVVVSDAADFEYDDMLPTQIQMFEINVNFINDAPVASDDTYSTMEDVPLEINLPGIIDNDFDVEGGQLVVSIVEDASHGLLELSSDGSFIYTPNQDYYGVDQFIYLLSDGELSDTAHVAIYVSEINDAPVALDSSVNALELEQTTIILLGQDVDGDSLTCSIIDYPLYGSLSDLTQISENSCSVIYTPNIDYLGEDSFIFQIDDGNGESDYGVIDIMVAPPYEESSPGDFNRDGFVNIVDIVLVIEFVISEDSPYVWELYLGDINEDGFINVLDIILIVNIVLESI